MAAIAKFISPLVAARLLGLCLVLSTPRVDAQAFESAGDELQMLQRAALRHAHLDERSRKSLETRLRLSALLPRLRVNVGRGWQWDYSTVPSSTTAPTLDDDRLSYGMSAQWDLSRLLFQREELILRRDAQRMAGFRAQLLLRVARIYGQRCHAIADRVTAKTEEASQQLAARIAALDVSLAALTGDDHIGRKLHHCSSIASSGLAEEVAAITADPLPVAPAIGDRDGLDDAGAGAGEDLN